ADGAHPRPPPAGHPGRGVYAGDHHRRIAPLLLRTHRALWVLGRQGATAALAGGSAASVRPVAQTLPAPPPGPHPLPDGLRLPACAPGDLAGPGLEWTVADGLRGTPQPDGASRGGRLAPPHLGHSPDRPRPAAPGRMVARLLPLRPAPPQ